MSRRPYFPILLVLALLLLMMGDRLPPPVGPFSAQVKQSANRFVLGLFPSWNPKLNPNQRTESQLEDAEKPR